jgi:hypothetical protein
MKKTALAATVLLAACASKTGVVPIGDGIYMLGMQDYSLNYHGAKVKAQLYGEAAEFCTKQGKRVQPVGDSATDAALYSNYASAEVKFRCV